jgi:hypothetical protein
MQGGVQRCDTLVLRLVDVRARVNQHPRRRFQTFARDKKQRRNAVFIRVVDVRARRDQQPHHFGVAVCPAAINGV